MSFSRLLRNFSYFSQPTDLVSLHALPALPALPALSCSPCYRCSPCFLCSPSQGRGRPPPFSTSLHALVPIGSSRICGLGSAPLSLFFPQVSEKCYSRCGCCGCFTAAPKWAIKRFHRAAVRRVEGCKGHASICQGAQCPFSDALKTFDTTTLGLPSNKEPLQSVRLVRGRVWRNCSSTRSSGTTASCFRLHRPAPAATTIALPKCCAYSSCRMS